MVSSLRWPIRTQLLVAPLTLLLGIVGITTWTALASAERARQDIENQVRNVARTLIEFQHIPLTNQGILRQMKGLSGADYHLIRPDGLPVTTLPIKDPELPSADAVAVSPETLRLGPRVVVDGEAFLSSGLRVPPRADVPQGATLYILYPEAEWRSARWAAVRPSLILGGFAGLAAVALSALVGHSLVRRVQELERRTRLIAAGDFSLMPLPGRNDELRDLGRSVNEMAEQLAHLQEAVRKTERLRLLGQVGGGLAHQMRNGLAGARLAVQLHASECAQGGDPEALQVALRELALLEAYLKRFLDLGREGPQRREPCSLRDLVEESVTLLRPRSKHARIALRWEPSPEPATVLGDAGQLGQVVLNVLGNAIEAAGPGGWVEVALRREEAPTPVVIIEVSDSGPGPPADLAGRLFEPFVTGKPEGVGLGLAVARQVIEQHGGRIDWRRDGEVTRFRIELPTGKELTTESQRTQREQE
jgi:signal transduction histidine kinase